MEPKAQAQTTFQSHIADNPYPGRGLVIGRNDAEELLIVYFIMGRSPNSQNRRFVSEGGILRTEPVDLAKVEDPSLIIYEAMMELPGLQIVSNGDQTRTVYKGLQNGERFEDALSGREREPDAPNYTPRISGLLRCDGTNPQIALSILKANPFDPALTDRYAYRPALPAPGYGVGLTTYMGDGNPLPSFVGDPLLLPLTGNANEVLEYYWRGLDENNRVALAVKAVARDGSTASIKIKNRHA